MLQDKLKNFTLILASGSPRRQQFLKEMGLEFEVRLKSAEEIYPKDLKGSEISNYLAELKAKAFKGSLSTNEILITSDTVVWHKDKSLAKASNVAEAYEMLKTMSGEWHEVITSVCFTTIDSQKTVHQITQVKFKKLTDDEIHFYIDAFKPYDKAGAYGIQDWIGLIGIEEIKGSYPNVVGLPTQLVYQTLTNMVS